MPSWRRALYGLGAVNCLWMVALGPSAGDWMTSTAGMAGLAMITPFWLRAEREAAALRAEGRAGR